jgi:hypothetical protein
MPTVENPGGRGLKFLPKSLRGPMFFGQNLKGIYYFVFYCISIKKICKSESGGVSYVISLTRRRAFMNTNQVSAEVSILFSSEVRGLKLIQVGDGGQH